MNKQYIKFTNCKNIITLRFNQLTNTLDRIILKYTKILYNTRFV